MLACVVALTPAFAGDFLGSLEKGDVELSSIAPINFGQEGILFIADPKASTVYAVDTGDTGDRSAATSSRSDIEGVDGRIASMLGVGRDELLIHDMAVNPISGSAYISVSRGKGPDAVPVLLHIAPEGDIETVILEDVAHSSASLWASPKEGRRGQDVRQDTITELAHINDNLIIAGLSNQEFSSRLRVFPFPFTGKEWETGLEIYHTSHGQWETHSPVRTFAPFIVDDEPFILSAHTCTPLMKIPVSDILSQKAKVIGSTIAELGNHNRPLDMLVYTKDEQNYLLITNSSRGVMKLAMAPMSTQESLTEEIPETGGVPLETITSLEDTLQIKAWGDSKAVTLRQDGEGPISLTTIPLPQSIVTLITLKFPALFIELGILLGGAAFSQETASPTVVLVDGEAGQVIKAGPLPGLLTRFLALESRTQRDWKRIFPIPIVLDAVGSGGEQPNVMGRYSVEGMSVVFTPQFPFSRRVSYTAAFRPLIGGFDRAPLTATLRLPEAASEATHVARVYPTAKVLPANLLKFYIEFSGPMARGNGFKYVHIEKEDRTRVVDPFPEIGVELWDARQERFTVLLDPGRIKRGIQVNEEVGLPLVPGKSYRLVVRGEWPDAAGRPLAKGYTKAFRVVEPDYLSPDPKTWDVEGPAADTRDPVQIGFPESLDGPLASQLIWLTDAQGAEVSGTVTLADGETGWALVPSAAWTAGTYTVHVLPRLEDLAGNQIRRPFEIDVQEENIDMDEEVEIPVVIR